ncbi:MAG TPA: hypothetical protein VFZ21_15145 [Gemmatimonadaceae bacterium]|jgi:hypothetical protein|nr:hypothetical protein [Gemmatimonadaceae bacterium]
MAKRFRDAGIPETDIVVGGPCDERMAIKSFYEGQEFLYRFTKALTGTRASTAQ